MNRQVADPNYTCPSYVKARFSPSTADHKWLKWMLTVTVLDIETTKFCYLARWHAVLQWGVMVPLPPDVAWPGESSGNHLSLLPGTLHLRCAARCTQAASAMIHGSKMGEQMPLTYSGSTATTSTTGSAGSMAPKTKMKYPRLHCSRNLTLRAALHSRWLRWSGHVQHAPSSIELIADLVIPGIRRWRRTRKT